MLDCSHTSSGAAQVWINVYIEIDETHPKAAAAIRVYLSISAGIVSFHSVLF